MKTTRSFGRNNTLSLNENPFQQIDWFMGDNVEVVNLRKIDEYDGRLK